MKKSTDYSRVKWDNKRVLSTVKNSSVGALLLGSQRVVLAGGELDRYACMCQTEFQCLLGSIEKRRNI